MTTAQTNRENSDFFTAPHLLPKARPLWNTESTGTSLTGQQNVLTLCYYTSPSPGRSQTRFTKWPCAGDPAKGNVERFDKSRGSQQSTKPDSLVPCPLELPAPGSSARLLWFPASPEAPARFLWDVPAHTPHTEALAPNTRLNSDLKSPAAPDPGQAGARGEGAGWEKLQHSDPACVLPGGDSSPGFLSCTAPPHQGSPRAAGTAASRGSCAQPHAAMGPAGTKDVGSCTWQTVETTPEPPARAGQRDREVLLYSTAPQKV